MPFGFGEDAEIYNRAISIIKAWKPGEHKNELGYRDELLSKLRQELNSNRNFLSALGNREVLVKKEDGRGLCDIAIETYVGIEMKKDLNSKSKVDRLIGQVNNYKRSYKDVIVVLVGKTNPEALTYLKEQLEDIRNSVNIPLNDKHIIIIDKGGSISANKSSQSSSMFGNLGFNI